MRKLRMPMFFKKISDTCKGLLSLVFIAMTLIALSIPLYVCAILKACLPFLTLQRHLNRAMILIGNQWIYLNNFWFKRILGYTWKIPNHLNLALSGRYFVTCNHQSWTDIIVLQCAFLNVIPFFRFFIKKQLFWFPFIGQACWAYDFPFMRRFSKDVLKKNPHLRDIDLKATKKACQKFQDNPVCIINFFEGTRFTQQKHHHQQSPYHHLLKPRSGGIAYAIEAFEGKIVHLVDVTLFYPNSNKGFWSFLCGKTQHVDITIKIREIPQELRHGKYLEDPIFKQSFQNWINSIWEEKDRLLSQKFSTDHKPN